MQIPVHRSTVRKGCVLAFFPWLQATQIFPHIVFGCKDKGFMGIWYTTGKVLTKNTLITANIYFAKLNSKFNYEKTVMDMPVANSINCCKSQEQSEFTVLQWNIWQEGTKVTGGYDAIVDEIIRLKPDFVTFSEVRNYNNTRFCDRIVQSLKAKGETYYSFYSYDSGLLSRHPITDSLTIFLRKTIMEVFIR